MVPTAFVGTAGWQVGGTTREHFTATGSHLEQYASTFNAAEINSCFYRPHRRSTYERWAASVPEAFRFSAKVPKLVTHDLRLVGVKAALEQFIGEVAGLGDRLGVLLVQLPPSFELELRGARAFFRRLTDLSPAAVVCEPRHTTWFTEAADRLFQSCNISRVGADPARVPEAALPRAFGGVLYTRLHGSPRMYYSSYTSEFLQYTAAQLDRETRSRLPTWCIFDNTAYGVATHNAVALRDLIRTSHV